MAFGKICLAVMLNEILWSINWKSIACLTSSDLRHFHCVQVTLMGKRSTIVKKALY